MKFAVVESRWAENERNLSVRPMFEMLRGIRGGQRSDYLYERFTGKKSFDELMSYLLQERSDVSLLYLASHGNEKCFGSVAGISFTELKNDLLKASQDEMGIYLGSCLFGSPDTNKRLLEAVPKLQWVAGYSEEVDWGDSSALDLIFFRRLLQSTSSREADKGRRAAERVLAKCLGLATDLGFNAWWRAADGSVEGLDAASDD